MHWGITDNFSFATVDDATIAVYCTNLRGAPLAEAMEAECGIPIYDTIATVVWKALLLAGRDPAAVTGWGRIFRVPG